MSPHASVLRARHKPTRLDAQARFRRHFCQDLAANRLFIALASPDPNDRFQINDEDLTVANRSGIGRAGDRFDNTISF